MRRRAAVAGDVTVPGRVFMGGVPMNWATNRLAGASYTSCGRAHLLQAPVGHDGDAVGHRHGLDLVVGDVDDRGLDPPVQVDELEAGLRPAAWRRGWTGARP